MERESLGTGGSSIWNMGFEWSGERNMASPGALPLLPAFDLHSSLPHQIPHSFIIIIPPIWVPSVSVCLCIFTREFFWQPWQPSVRIARVHGFRHSVKRTDKQTDIQTDKYIIFCQYTMYMRPKERVSACHCHWPVTQSRTLSLVSFSALSMF